MPKKNKNEIRRSHFSPST